MFSHIDTWVFDLDNTLYDAEPYIFPEMGKRMTAYVADTLKISIEEADKVRQSFWQQHGTTLRGLMVEWGIDPLHFLNVTHDYDISPVPQCLITQEGLKKLPGRKIIFTNAPRNFAERMTKHLGIHECFEAIHTIEDAEFLPKPAIEAYELFLQRHAIDPTRACMFEDMEKNLAPAHVLGLTTVWLHGEKPPVTPLPPHTHHAAERLKQWFETAYLL